MTGFGRHHLVSWARIRVSSWTDTVRKIELEGPEQIVSKGYALQGSILTTIFG